MYRSRNLAHIFSCISVEEKNEEGAQNKSASCLGEERYLIWGKRFVKGRDQRGRRDGTKAAEDERERERKERGREG